MFGQIASVMDNALLQGLTYGIAVLGVSIAFRALRYPDLTADGSFLLGAAVFASAIDLGWTWPFAMAAVIAVGAGCGLVTAALNSRVGVNRLLSGILTSMMCYSVAFWVLSGRSNVNVADKASVFGIAEQLESQILPDFSMLHPVTIIELLAVSGLVMFVVHRLLTSDLGIILRAMGDNEDLVESTGRQPKTYVMIGLAVANGAVGLSGGLVVARQGFADVNMGFGVIITFVAALVIGEELLRLLGWDPARNLKARVLSGLVGGCVYFLLYLTILRLSILGYLPIRIQPTDLKLMSAGIVVAFVFLRYRTRRSRTIAKEEFLPI